MIHHILFSNSLQSPSYGPHFSGSKSVTRSGLAKVKRNQDVWLPAKTGQVALIKHRLRGNDKLSALEKEALIKFTRSKTRNGQKKDAELAIQQGWVGSVKNILKPLNDALKRKAIQDARRNRDLRRQKNKEEQNQKTKMALTQNSLSNINLKDLQAYFVGLGEGNPADGIHQHFYETLCENPSSLFYTDLAKHCLKQDSKSSAPLDVLGHEGLAMRA